MLDRRGTPFLRILTAEAVKQSVKIDSSIRFEVSTYIPRATTVASLLAVKAIFVDAVIGGGSFYLLYLFGAMDRQPFLAHEVFGWYIKSAEKKIVKFIR